MAGNYGLYPIVTYLFIKTLPKSRTFLTMLKHIFLWIIPSIFIEYFAVKLGYMKYGYFWNIGWSYAAHWILFIIFYKHHKWRENHTEINKV